MNRIMIVDDEPGVLNALQRALRGEGWALVTFSDPEAALNAAVERPVDLVISDYRMPVIDGITLLKELKAVQPDTLRMVLSGQADLDSLVHAINEAEIYRFIAKPWNDVELKVTIQQALDHRALMLENRRLADLVRRQQAQIDYQTNTLERLESECPGITQVNWGDDGSIIISEGDR